MTRLENKDAAARTTKEWRIVARVLDRIFFFCYIGTIVVSLFTIFPRDGGPQEHAMAASTTTAPPEVVPPEVVPEDVDVEPVTESDLSYVFGDYSNVDYR